MSSVSVVIPTYNRATLVRRATESVLAQTHAAMEILVCDDGSTDDTRAVVAAIADPRVRFVACGRHGRPAGPRNVGLRMASGEWLAFLDSDDEWSPTKLARQLEAAARLGTRAACTDALRVLPAGGTAGLVVGGPYAAELGFRALLEGNRVVCSSAMVRREVLETVGGFPEDAALAGLEDYALWLRVATQTTFAMVPEPLVRYTDDPPNSLRGRDARGPWRQRQRVLGSFLSWSANHLPAPSLVARASAAWLHAGGRHVLRQAVR